MHNNVPLEYLEKSATNSKENDRIKSYEDDQNSTGHSFLKPSMKKSLTQSFENQNSVCCSFKDDLFFRLRLEIEFSDVVAVSC